MHNFYRKSCLILFFKQIKIMQNVNFCKKDISTTFVDAKERIYETLV